jgi:hypothetical protein
LQQCWQVTSQQHQSLALLGQQQVSPWQGGHSLPLSGQLHSISAWIPQQYAWQHWSRQGKSACEDALHNLHIKQLKPERTFEALEQLAGGPPPSGTHDVHQTLELPSGEAALPMRKDVSFGHIHTFKDEGGVRGSGGGRDSCCA